MRRAGPAQSGGMRRVRTATGVCFAATALVLLANVTPARATEPPREFPETADAGTRTPVSCRLKDDVCPSVGHGCHIKWEERMEDGSWVDAMAPLQCNRSIQVCGREIWCTCPSPGHARGCTHTSHR